MTKEQEREPPLPSAALHTMQSDVSEYLKTAKPTLLTLIARQAEAGSATAPDAKPSSPSSRAIAGAVIAAIIIVGSAVGYLSVTRQSSPPPPPVAVAPPPPFITPEATEEIIVERPQELIRELGRTAGTPQLVGTFRRLIIRTRGAGDARLLITMRQLFDFLGTPAPAFVDSIAAPPQFYRYEEASGPRLVLMAEAKNAARAIEDLHHAEPSLAHDLAFLFPGSSPPFSLAAFEDRIYRNIDFRYLPLEGAGGRGIGYLQFRAKRLIIMATSEEAIRLVINRLLPNR